MSTSPGRFSLGSLVLIPLLMVACAGPRPPDGITPRQAHLYAHYDRAGEVHDALVRVQMDRARAAARWLVDHPETRMVPPDSEPFASAMTASARSVVAASDLHDAAMATAQMGRICGDCHLAYGVELQSLVATAPPDGAGPTVEMARHVWAADRMWQGLIAPDDYAWTSGAKALSMGWLNPGDVAAAPGDRERLRGLIRQVYALAIQAETASDSETRAEVYGAFLVTCIDCHQLTGAIIR
jgi:hypothetical protein